MTEPIQSQDTTESVGDARIRQREIDLLMCSMPEITPPKAHACQLPGDGRRLNIVLPVLSEKLSFAGMQTAQRLFLRLLDHFDFGRIIVTHESLESCELTNWPEWTVGDREFSKRNIIFLGRKDEVSITVAMHDFFIATSWTAAIFTESLRKQQRDLLQTTPRQYVYFIQDYEPLFYPASPQYCLAESSYEKRSGTIALFNTKALADYFSRRGLTFPEHFVHEPMLHPTLDAMRSRHHKVPKERLIFVYSRPAFQRNGFRLLIEGLKHWARTYSEATLWTVVSAGGKHPSLYIPGGITIHALHKLTLEDYGALLSRTWVGLSLSFTAHPGQIPQELAEFGAWSITNSCETRQAAAMPRNMLALAELSPAAIARALSFCCSRYQPGSTSVIDREERIFRQTGEEFEFVNALISSWQ